MADLSRHCKCKPGEEKQRCACGEHSSRLPSDSPGNFSFQLQSHETKDDSSNPSFPTSKQKAIKETTKTKHKQRNKRWCGRNIQLQWWTCNSSVELGIRVVTEFEENPGLMLLQKWERIQQLENWWGNAFKPAVGWRRRQLQPAPSACITNVHYVLLFHGEKKESVVAGKCALQNARKERCEAAWTRNSLKGSVSNTLTQQ